MRRIALLLAGIGLAVAGSVGSTTATAKEPAILHTAAELAVVGGEIQQPKLAWLEPQTLAQLNRGVVKLADPQSPVLSPSGAKVAVGSSSMGIRIADVRRMKLLRGSIAKRSGWTISPISWPTARRLLALEWSERLGQMLTVTDPAARRVLERISINGYSTWARAGKLVVALGGEAERIGPARLLVVDENGTRSIQFDRIQAGGVMEGSGEETTYRTASPGLAVDPAIGHAYVVGETGLVADIDLASLAVDYREVNRPASLFGRLLDWLQPAAHAKRQAGWQRQAVSLGGGKLAVAGSDYDGFGSHPTTTGLELFDLEAGIRRTLVSGASYVQAEDGVLLAAGGSWDGRTEMETGVGLTAVTYDGERLWHALGDEPVWWFQVAGGYVYVGGKEAYPPTVRVIDLANGAVRTVRGQLPFFVTG